MPERSLGDALCRALERLEADGLVSRVGPGPRATRRWQAAVARAALRLKSSGEERDSLTLPIALALVELYGDQVSEDDLADMVEVLLPVTFADLEPLRPRRKEETDSL